MTQIAMCFQFSTIDKMHRMYRLQLTNYKSSASTIGANLNCDYNKNVATCCDSFTTYKFQTSTQANKQSHACNNKFFVNLSFGAKVKKKKKLAFFSLKSFQNTYKTSKSGFLHGEIIIISIT
jgi:hypothetical protein